MLARYPDLTIENCGSGGGRMEYAMLSHLQLQSSSDQEDYRLYPGNRGWRVGRSLAGATCHLVVSACDSDADAATFNLVNAMLFRIHQSGHMAELTPKVLLRLRPACKSTRIRFGPISDQPCRTTHSACRT